MASEINRPPALKAPEQPWLVAAAGLREFDFVIGGGICNCRACDEMIQEGLETMPEGVYVRSYSPLPSRIQQINGSLKLGLMKVTMAEDAPLEGVKQVLAGLPARVLATVQYPEENV